MSIRECLDDIYRIVDPSFDPSLGNVRFAAEMLDTEDLDNSELDPRYWGASMCFLIDHMLLLRESYKILILPHFVRRIHDLLVGPRRNSLTKTKCSVGIQCPNPSVHIRDLLNHYSYVMLANKLRGCRRPT